MLLRTFILMIGFALATAAQGQHVSFIGKTKDHVKETVRSEYRGFGIDNSIVKQQFNYLKYINVPGTITWIIYFTDDDICRSTKKVCDYTEYDDVLEELNDLYEQTGDNQWEYQSEGTPVKVSLEEKDWYFTVREQRKQ